MNLLGIDTGGTFTDFVYYDGNVLRVHKVLSTPEAPEKAILQGIGELKVSPEDLLIVHGSTVATNAVLEGKGVRTAYITNRGFRDVLTIGRQARKALYELQPELTGPPVPRELCLETGGRISAQGEILEPLAENDLNVLRGQIEALAPQAVAINLLFSFLDDRYEKKIESVIPENIFISRSSDVLPEYREYERGMATWLNAWTGPLVQGYLTRLENCVTPARLAIMQSSGGTIEATQAGQHAVNMLLSGPAGGLSGARFTGKCAGRTRLLTFDMGGTSTDVALIDGDISLTTEGSIAGYPVAVPMVDMHTIGAGGGSIASVDEGGMLHVGPESAGASPGPACYGKGGSKATVTDANLVLGRLRPDDFLGGSMHLDLQASVASVNLIADKLGCTLEEAAEGIIRLANEHMARALRVISIQRGVDSRAFTLVSFGGAGGLHVCALADALGMHQAMVPVHGGVLSALGMLATPSSRELSRTFTGELRKLRVEELEEVYQELMTQGVRSLKAEGIPRDELTILRSMDLRYLGQSYTLNVALPDEVPDLSVCERDFHVLHLQRYGHDMDEPVQLVNLRLSLRGQVPDVALAVPGISKSQKLTQSACVHGLAEPVPVFRREVLQNDECITGPALITETVATTWLEEGWVAKVHASGSLLLEKSGLEKSGDMDKLT